MKLKLTPKLTLIFVLFAAALLGIVNGLVYNSGQNALEDAAIAELESIAGEKQAALNAWLDGKQADIQALVDDPALPKEVYTLTTSTSENNLAFDLVQERVARDLQLRVMAGEFRSLMLLDPQTGNLLLSTDPKDNGKPQDTPAYFFEGKRGTYITPVYYSVDLRATTITAAAPIVSDQGKLLGVLVGRISLDELNMIVQRRSGRRQTDDAFLINASHQLVTQPRFRRDPAVLQQKLYIVPVNRCLEGKSGSVFANDYQGVPVIAVYRWLPERQMCLIVKISQTEALAKERTFGVQSIWIGLIALLIASVVAVGLSHTIVRPLRVMQFAAQRYGQGDLNVRLPETRFDELGSLAHEFNTMAASLAKQDNLLRHYSLGLEQRVAERTAELAQSEARYRSLFENMLSGYAYCQMIFEGDQPQDFIYLEVNRAFESLTGLKEVEGKKISEIIPGIRAANPELFEAYGRVALTGQPERFETFLRPLNLWFWISVYSPQQNYFVAVFDNITERKQAEAAILESEEKFKYVFDHSVVAKSITHMDGTLAVNQAFCDMLGYSRSELLDTKWKEVTHPEDVELSNCVVDLLVSGEKESFRFTKRYLHKDGSVVWGDVSLSLRRDPEGKPLYFMTAVVDITERKLAEIRLAESLEFNERILTSSPVGIFTYKLSGECLSANAAAAEMVGGTISQLQSQNFHEIESWKRSGLYALALQTIQTRNPRAEDVHHLTTFGRDAWYRVQFALFRAGGEDLLLMMFSDITERKQVEIQLAESLDFNERILTSAPVGILAYKFTGEFVSANAYASQIIEATPEQLRLQNFHELESWKQSGLYDLAQKAMAEDTHVGGDIHHITTFGKEKWFSIQLVTFKSRGEDLLLVIVNDISERKRAEDTLRRFELLSANSRDIILFVRSEDGRLLDANQAAMNAYGYSREELLTLTVNHLRAPEGRAQTSDQFARAEAGGIQFETVHLRKDGSSFPVEVSSQGATIGGIRTLVSIIRDITDRKYAEAALAASEKRFRTWIEHASDIITVMDASGIIQYESPSIRHLLGYEPEELLGKKPFDLVHPEDRDQLIALFVETIRDLDASVTFEYRIRHKDGSWRFLEALGHAFVDEHEEVVALIHSRDITDRRNAEAALRASEQRFRDYFEMGLIGMAITSPTKGIVEVNDQMCEILDFRREELLQMDWTMLTHPDDLAVDLAHFNRVLAGEIDGYSLDKRWVRKDGRVVDTIISVKCTRRADSSIDYFLALVQDITDRKRAEEALQEKERLLSEAQRIGQIGSLSYDIVEDRFQFSEEMYHLLDVSAEKFQHNSQDFLAVVYPSDRPDAATWFIDLREGWQAKTLDFRLFRRNGELRYLHCNGALEFNSEGKPVRFLGTTQDVTERKLAEIQINQQLKHLTALSEIDRAIISGLDQREILEVILSQTLSQLQVDAADIFLLDSDGQSLRYAAGQGFRTTLMEKIQVRLGNSFAGRVAKDRRLWRVPNLEEHVDDPLFDILVREEKFVSYVGIPLIIMKEVKGVLEVFHRSPFQPYHEWLDFLNTLAGQATIAVENTALLGNLKSSNAELSQAYDATIEGWSHAMDLRDKETEGHTQRVVHLTLEMARGLGMSESKLPHIRRGALLHDIGKLGIPDSILLKPDKLTSEEWEVMKKHPEYAYEMLSPIQYLKPSLSIPYFHHEKWDGSGYPLGLRGEQIPLEARIFAIVDVWDALRSDRPYRKAWTEERTLEYIRSLAGIQFDPTVVDYFMELMKA